MDFSSPQFWIAVGQIILIDILLGGDNAVVIALACRRLPEQQRRLGIFWGVVGAVGLRIGLIFFALKLLEVPYLKAVGAVLLVWIGIKLLLPEDEDGHGQLKASGTLMGAIWTIVVADAVMSLDNVIAVAGAAHGNLTLVVFGIVVSIPLIVWGSQLVLRLMDRFPWVITLGGALLGWIAGGMLMTDAGISSRVTGLPPGAGLAASVTGALLVIAVGKFLARHGKS